MNIVNLTPHQLNIYDENGKEVITLPPSGQLARIQVTKEKSEEMSRRETVYGIPFFNTLVGEPEGLPEESIDTIYVVSGMFRANYPRADLFQPGELLRNEAGQPIGCIGLSQ